MSRVKTLLLLFIAFGLTCILIMNVLAESPPPDKPDVTIRKAPKEVVLYTIHRGPYDKVGPAIGNLFALAGQKGIIPRGAPYHVYLNNPQRVSSQHYLTEIRIPVGQEALKLTGSLGPMTDVKSLPATDFAVAVKPEGLADPSPIYNSLYKWILQEGYIVVSSPRELFLTNAMSADYTRMKTEIMIPVQSLLPAKQ